MLAGRQIAQELCILIGSGGYDPSQQPDSRHLPQTMRELIEGDFDHDDINLFEKPEINFKIGMARRNYFAPIRARQLSIRRPTPPAIQCGDYRGYYHLLKSFYQWLKARKQAGGIDIDHHLEQNPEGWPLLDRFASEIHKRTGWYIDDFFPQRDWEYNNDEPQDWGCAWMPLYEIEYEENAAPVIEYLCRIYNPDEQLPEAAYDSRDPQQVGAAGEKLAAIIRHQRYNLLPDVWANAFKAIEKYGSGLICYSEPDWMRMEIDSADDIEEFFKEAKAVADMMDGTFPLIKLFRENSEKAWDDIISHLVSLPIRKKTKTKTLVQLFNEKQRVKIKV